MAIADKNVKESDSQAYADLSFQATALAKPVAGVSPSFRKSQFLNAVLTAHGMNTDGTRNADLPILITGDDAAKLVTRAIQLIDAPINDPDFDRVLERGVSFLTGGSRDQWGISGTAPDRVNAARFIDDMTEDALTDPNFDADAWYSKNFMSRYGNKRLEDSMSKITSNIVNSFPSGGFRTDLKIDGITYMGYEVDSLRNEAVAYFRKVDLPDEEKDQIMGYIESLEIKNTENIARAKEDARRAAEGGR